MTEVRIVAIVGMKGAGKTTAVRYLAAKGMPKVGSEKDVILEIRNLVASGQHEIVLDGVESWKELINLKHEFPTQVRVIAIVAPRVLRWRRLAQDAEKDLTQAEIQDCDRIEIEDFGVGAMVAVADAYVCNDKKVGDLQQKLEEVIQEVR